MSDLVDSLTRHGADLLFQVISQRYGRGSLILTTNQPYKNWAKVFNHDATLTSAVLDRLLHHAETVIIEGRSYRMKDQIDEPEGSEDIRSGGGDASVAPPFRCPQRRIKPGFQTGTLTRFSRSRPHR